MQLYLQQTAQENKKCELEGIEYLKNLMTTSANFLDRHINGEDS